MTNNTASFKSTLRHWRELRKISQLELALNADVSQRHISWLETGRSQPSRDMVIKLSEAMDVPLRDRNHLLNTAGFSNAYTHKKLDEPSMAPVNAILETILTNHEPYPAYVLDRYWNITMQNRASKMMFEVAGDPDAIWRAIGDNGEHNIALLTVHPNGLRNHIQNWADIIGPFVRRLKKEVMVSDNPQLTARYEQLAEHIDDDINITAPSVADQLLPVLPIEFGAKDTTLKLYSVISTFGTAQDITANELRIETFYPCDEQTTKFFTE